MPPFLQPFDGIDWGFIKKTNWSNSFVTFQDYLDKGTEAELVAGIPLGAHQTVH